MSASPSDTAAGGFDRLYGGVLTEVTADLVVAEVTVRDVLLGPDGELHGGVLAALAEDAAVAGTRLEPASGSSSVRVISNIVSLLEPVDSGTVRARAVRRHGGRTTSVWEVELTGDGGRRCAVARVTVAVRG
jgi:1,4-dihydroxy-2-naphthoyl-CoA hydrolase